MSCVNSANVVRVLKLELVRGALGEECVLALPRRLPRRPLPRADAWAVAPPCVGFARVCPRVDHRRPAGVGRRGPRRRGAWVGARPH